MTFGKFRLKPKPEHLQAVLEVLNNGELLSPQAIAQRSGLSHTQVRCALDALEKADKLNIVEQVASPKLRVSLKDTA